MSTEYEGPWTVWVSKTDPGIVVGERPKDDAIDRWREVRVGAIEPKGDWQLVAAFKGDAEASAWADKVLAEHAEAGHTERDCPFHGCPWCLPEDAAKQLGQIQAWFVNGPGLEEGATVAEHTITHLNQLKEMLMGEPGRPQVYVHTDHNPDEVRTFYEVPQAIVDRVCGDDDERTFAQALADMVVETS